MNDIDKATILAVDDAPENLDILTGLLGDKYKMKVAINGIIALKIAQATPLPDLILLDVRMPGMSGFDVARELQSNPATSEIPIIFVTAETNADAVKEGFSAGGVDYVLKPFNPEELQARVRNHLSLKAAREKLEDMSRKLGKYLSPLVYDSIVKGHKNVEISSYRKMLTVCFTDIVGFTNRTENMDHNEMTDWINGYLNDMAQIVIEAGGTLDKFIGDAVMTFFGDPNSEGIENDALNCIKMAQTMIEKAKAHDIEIRVGINTGMCTIGNFGSEDRMDYTILGKEVNLASRLESNGEPGQILLSENTYQLIQDKFECQAHGQIDMKGIDRGIETYLVE